MEERKKKKEKEEKLRKGREPKSKIIRRQSFNTTPETETLNPKPNIGPKGWELAPQVDR